MDLTEDEVGDIVKILKRVRRGGWQGKSLALLIENINRIRAGEVSIKDWIVPDVCTYEECLYDLGLNKYV